MPSDLTMTNSDNIINAISSNDSSSLAIKPKKSGLAPLILTLVELLRQLMEAQVIRRMDDEQLTDAEIETPIVCKP